MQTIPPEILHQIFKLCPTPNLILTCKHWKNIILQQSTTCDKCSKITTMYDTTLWVDLENDAICHGYYGTLEKYNILREMLRNKPQFLQHINRQSLGLCYQAIKHDYRAIKLVKHITDPLICKVIEGYPKYIESSNYTYNQYLKFVEANGKCLQYVPKEYHTNELYMMAIKQTPKALKYIEDQTEKLSIYAIHHNLWKLSYIQFIKNFTEDIYVELYKSNNKSIMHFKYNISL